MKVKFIKNALLVLSCIYAIFFIVCIWTDWFNSDLFAKVSLTVAVIYALLFIFYLIDGVNSDKDLKKKGFLSD